MTEPWRQHWTRHRPPRGQEARARIPSTLHFNFKINLLAAPWDALSWPLRLMHANVHRTIELHPNATVNFFNDTQCRAALLNHRLGAALARSFDTEEDGRLRSDMCRLAQLASSGGFYFDTDLGVRGDMRRILDQRTTLAVPEAHQEDPSGTSGNAPGFFQAFLAVSPGHPVIELALERHAAWYAAMARGDEVEVTRVTRGLHRPSTPSAARTSGRSAQCSTARAIEPPLRRRGHRAVARRIHCVGRHGRTARCAAARPGAARRGARVAALCRAAAARRRARRLRAAHWTRASWPLLVRRVRRALETHPLSFSHRLARRTVFVGWRRCPTSTVEGGRGGGAATWRRHTAAAHAAVAMGH
jgi:hypothetical protein